MIQNHLYQALHPLRQGALSLAAYNRLAGYLNLLHSSIELLLVNLCMCVYEMFTPINQKAVFFAIINDCIPVSLQNDLESLDDVGRDPQSRF